MIMKTHVGFSFIALLGMISVANAQTERKLGSELSFGVNGGLAVGDFNKTHGGMIGGDLKYAYNFDPAVAVTLQSGYNNFFGKKVLETSLVDYKYKSLGQIPIKAGVRFSMGQFYAEPQLGVSFFTGAGDGSAFTYAGNIGVQVTPSFDISARYEGWSKNSSNLGFVGLRLAYTFPMN